MKTCSCCKINKDKKFFHKSKNRYDGLHPYCKECRQQKAKNDEWLKGYRKQWYLKNKQSCIDRQTLRYNQQTDEIKQYKKLHYGIHCDEIKAKSRDYYHENKTDPEFIEKRRINVNNWRKKNRHITAWRSILATTIKKLKQKKNTTTQMLLGYSAENLKHYIESKWLNGMSWENYGEWHIDHIRPISSFEPSTHPSIVNSLDNLQPLWAVSKTINGEVVEGNLNKGAKWQKQN